MNLKDAKKNGTHFINLSVNILKFLRVAQAQTYLVHLL